MLVSNVQEDDQVRVISVTCDRSLGVWSLPNDTEVELVQSAWHWVRWPSDRVERTLALIPDDHELYDLMCDELEQRGHEADVRRLNGGVMP